MVESNLFYFLIKVLLKILILNKNFIESTNTNNITYKGRYLDQLFYILNIYYYYIDYYLSVYNN